MDGTIHRSDWDVYRLLATSTDPWSLKGVLIPDSSEAWDQWSVDLALDIGRLLIPGPIACH